MHRNDERPRPGQGIEGAKDGTSCKPFLPVPIPSVNTDNPRLWRVLRRFDRNLKKMALLRERNAALLEEMRRLQGVGL